ncbi:hypothetical protein BURK1_00760 [Burkholderiales bacterium]|nr:hypothetical protein BURK1_00760 [Burkholderiales bacterium]
MDRTRRTVLEWIAAGALGGGAAGALAQPAPAYLRSTQPLRLVQGFPPGGAVDRVARVLAPELARDLGRPVIGEHLPGANGIRAIRAVAESTSDADVLLFATSAIANRSDPNVADSRVDTLRPVIMTSTTPMVLVVRASLGIDDVVSFAERLKRGPALSYGSSGVGNGTHIAPADLVKRIAGLAVHVPYQGGPPMLNDLVGGHIDFAMLGVSATLAQLPTLRLLAVSTAKRTRLPRFDGLPTIAETILPEYDISLWQALLAPPMFSQASILDLNRRLNDILALERVRIALADAGAEPVGGSPDTAAALIRAEVERFARIVGR